MASLSSSIESPKAANARAESQCLPASPSEKLPEKRSTLPVAAVAFEAFAYIPLPQKPTGANKIDKVSLGGDKYGWFKQCSTTSPDSYFGRMFSWFKKKEYTPTMAKIESAISSFVRQFLHNQSPRSRPVYDKLGNCLGSLSTDIPGFKTFGELKTCPDKNTLVERGFADHITLRHIVADEDGHRKQYGCVVDKEGKICGMIYSIDYEKACFPYTFQYMPPSWFAGLSTPKPQEAFPITAYDITHLPNIKDIKPCHWVTTLPKNGNPGKVYLNTTMFSALETDPAFAYQKYFTYLRFLINDQEAQDRLLGTNFSSDNDEDQKILQGLTQFLRDVRDKFENQLIEDREFRQMLLETKEIFQSSLDDVERYNATIGTEEGVHRDLDKIEQELHRLLKRCLIVEIHAELLSALWEKILKLPTSEDFKASFHQLRAFLLELQNNEGSLLQSLTECLQKMRAFISQIPSRKSDWQYLPEDLFARLELYRAAAYRFENQEVDRAKYHRTVLENSQPFSLDQDLLHRHLAQAVFDWLSNPTHLGDVRTIVELAWNEYKPTQYSWKILNWTNPYQWSRERCPHFQEALTELNETGLGSAISPIKKFLQKGGWNGKLDVVVTSIGGESANPTLINKICIATLDQLKNHRNIEDYANPEKVRICGMIKNGEWDALRIGQLFLELVGPDHPSDPSDVASGSSPPSVRSRQRSRSGSPH